MRWRRVKGSRFSMPDEPAHEDQVMKWQTPQAVDQRFGFEITMYIARR